MATRLAPRLSLWGAAAAVVVLVSIAPLMGRIGDRLIPVSVHHSLENSHSRERVDIWRGFGMVVEDHPFHGFGIGVSSRMAELPVAARVPPELRTWLPVGHPHNAALQIWVELGMAGATLGLAVVLLVLLRLKDLPADRLAPRLALFGAVAAISLIGHGAWQGWWPAAVGAAVVWLRSAECLSKETSHEHL
jgi:O-antigen ligase